MNHLRLRKELWIKNPSCFVCEKPILDFTDSTLEHIIPLSRGGANSRKNLSISHRLCNELEGNLICPNDWKKRIEDYFSPNDLDIWKRPLMSPSIFMLIKDSFNDSQFILETLSFLPFDESKNKNHNNGLDFQIQTIQKLKSERNLSFLVEGSKAIHLPNTRSYWKIIFGLLFLDHYEETKDVTSILHAIWRLNSFTQIGGNRVMHSYTMSLLELCRDLEPIAYERWMQRC